MKTDFGTKKDRYTQSGNVSESGLCVLLVTLTLALVRHYHCGYGMSHTRRVKNGRDDNSKRERRGERRCLLSLLSLLAVKRSREQQREEEEQTPVRTAKEATGELGVQRWSGGKVNCV
jgi:hypothetical protein